MSTGSLACSSLMFPGGSRVRRPINCFLVKTAQSPKCFLLLRIAELQATGDTQLCPSTTLCVTQYIRRVCSVETTSVLEHPRQQPICPTIKRLMRSSSPDDSVLTFRHFHHIFLNFAPCSHKSQLRAFFIPAVTEHHDG